MIIIKNATLTLYMYRDAYMLEFFFMRENIIGESYENLIRKITVWTFNF